MTDHLAANLQMLCSTHRSVSEVCRHLNFNRQQFARYLSGESRPSHHNLRRIADGFGIGVDDLLRPNPGLASRGVAATAEHRRDRLLDRAFPGDLQKLRPFLGYYHMHFLVPYAPGSIVRSLTCLSMDGAKTCSKTIERSSLTEGTIGYLSKYEGVVSYLGNCIFLVEFETLSNDSIVETVLFPSYRKKLDILTGLTFGVTSQVHRQPFASPVAWKYLGRTIQIRDAISVCGTFAGSDRSIDPRVRKFLRSEDSSRILTLNPS
jgi:transcriptional regulator with XRE-family HTH domain